MRRGTGIAVVSAVSVVAVTATVLIVAMRHEPTTVSIAEQPRAYIGGYLVLFRGRYHRTDPLAGSILVVPTNSTTGGPFTTTTALDGTYSLWVPPGDYVIYGESPGFGPCRMTPPVITASLDGNTIVAVSCEMKT